MKTIAKSLLFIFALASLSAGATWSYFNDTATISGNTFSSGTLAIEAGGQKCQNHYGWYENGNSHIWHEDEHCDKKFHRCQHLSDDCNGTTRFEIQNAQPGNCESKIIKIKNTGTLPARNLEVNLLKSSDALCEALEVTTQDISAIIIPPKDSENISVEICFLENGTDQSDLQGKTCNFDLNVSAKAYEEGSEIVEILQD